MEDGDTEKYHASRVIQDFVLLSWKRGCIRCISLQVYDNIVYKTFLYQTQALTRPRCAVGNVSGYRCVSDGKSRGREFDPGPVPYFRGD